MQARPRTALRRVMQLLFVVAALLVLVAPMVVQFALRSEPRRGENRAPAALPAWPGSLAGLPGWTAGVDAWLKDHFGLRRRYLDVLDQIHYRIFGGFGSPQILMGREGRIFLASHGAGEEHRNSLIRIACGAGVAPEQPRAIARSLATVLERTDAAGTGQSYAILVPSASALYPSQLPPWLARLCRDATPLAESVAAAVPARMQHRAVSLYPVLAALDAATPAIPRHNFHWDGAGPRLAGPWIAETLLGRRPAFALPTRLVRKRSDITGFFPGLRIEEEVVQADEAGAGVTTCIGPPCFAAELGAEAARLMEDLRRHNSPQAQGRLLLLTDSFGRFVAADFTPYFGQVVQVSLNNLPLLTADQRARVRQALVAEYRPDMIVYLIHDYAATYYWDVLLRDLLPPRGVQE
jgi:hypothetical protein